MMKIDGIPIEDIGSFLRNARMIAGLTQKSVAEKAGIGPTLVSKAESGKIIVDVALAQKIVGAITDKAVTEATQICPQGRPLSAFERNLLCRLIAAVRHDPDYQWAGIKNLEIIAGVLSTKAEQESA